MTFQPKTILMPFGFNDASFAAWSFARSLAARFDARLIALHVHEPSPEIGDYPALRQTPEEKDAARRRLGETLGRGVQIRFGEGRVVDVILEAAAAEKADLILMATEGRTGLHRFLGSGSVTEAVVRRSTLPVLSVHGHASIPVSVLAPLNLAAYSYAGLDAARAFSGALDANLTLLNVDERSESPSRSADHLELRALAEGLGAQAASRAGRAVDGILAEAPAHGLVVLVARRKGALRDAFLGTTAEQVLRRCPVPVLSVPEGWASRPGAGKGNRKRQASSTEAFRPHRRS